MAVEPATKQFEISQGCGLDARQAGVERLLGRPKAAIPTFRPLNGFGFEPNGVGLLIEPNGYEWLIEPDGIGLSLGSLVEPNGRSLIEPEDSL